VTVAPSHKEGYGDGHGNVLKEGLSIGLKDGEYLGLDKSRNHKKPDMTRLMNQAGGINQ